MTVKTYIARMGRGATDPTFKVDFDFGDNHEQMVARFGAEVVYEHAYDNMVIALQARIRSLATKTNKRSAMNQEQIVAEMATWEPGVSTRKRVDVAAKIATDFKKIDVDARKKLLAELMASLEGETPSDVAPSPVVVPEAHVAAKALRKGGKSRPRS